MKEIAGQPPGVFFGTRYFRSSCILATFERRTQIPKIKNPQITQITQITQI